MEGNLELALAEEPRPGAARKLTGKEKALLAAAACSDPPAGRARWTLELLSDALVKLTEHESLSPIRPARQPSGTCSPTSKDTIPRSRQNPKILG